MLLLANGEFSNFCFEFKFVEDFESKFDAVALGLVAVFDEVAVDDGDADELDEESSKLKYSKCNHSICSFVSEASVDEFVFDRGFDWFMWRFFDDR
jgi:hypothetical protein